MTASSVGGQPKNLATVIGLACALVGAGIGAQRLADNSFLTHLATGRQTLESGIVREDVFTWTSGGEPVVVQSWLASLIFALVEDIAGFGALRLLFAVLAASLGALTWRLTAGATSLATRVMIMVPTLWIGLRTWSERPLLFAFVFFALVLVGIDEERDPRPLALVGVLWVNIHGSWPLVIVYVLARIAGRVFDRAPFTVERRALLWLGGGLLAGGIANPYGPKLLWFPVQLLERQETLRYIAEWQASSFQATWTRMFLVMIAGVVVAARKAPWRHVVPGLVFVVAALLSARNIPVAAIVVLPLLAAGLPALPGPDAERQSEAVTLGVKLLAVLVVVLPMVGVRAPHVDTGRYPVEAIDAMEDLGISPAEVATVHQDFVGNYLDLRYGAAGASWIDDRFELHAPELVEDYVTLLDGGSEWRAVLERYDPAAIVWSRDRVLVDLVTGDDGWTIAWENDDWVVLCRGADSVCT